MTRSPHWAGLVRFVKSILAGLVASGVDMGILVLLVDGFSLEPTIAIIPAQIAGSGVQFLGNRHLVFSATGAQNLRRQIVLFAGSEAVSWGLTWAGYSALLYVFHINYALARIVVAAVVYCAFSYPSWKLIFHEDKSHPKNRSQNKDLSSETESPAIPA